MDEYIVYVRTDERNRITEINSSAFVGADWGVEIDHGTGDRYHHAQGNYFAGGLRTEDGICRWKYADGAVMLRTEQEIEWEREHRPPAPPSQQEIDRADIDYCLMMLGDGML